MSPFPSTVWNLPFNNLEDVIYDSFIWDPVLFPEKLCIFRLHELEITIGFSFHYFLQNPQEGRNGKESTPGEVSYRSQLIGVFGGRLRLWGSTTSNRRRNGAVSKRERKQPVVRTFSKENTQSLESPLIV